MAKAKGINWTKLRHRLGREPDTAIARELGIAPESVLIQRQWYGIPSYRAQQRASAKAAILDAKDMLGKVADHKVAKVLGVKASTVKWERERLGIFPRKSCKNWKGG